MKWCVSFHLNSILHCVVHSCVPLSFVKVVCVPLIKDKSKSIDDINNYRPRPVLIFPIVSKYLNRVYLNIYVIFFILVIIS